MTRIRFSSVVLRWSYAFGFALYGVALFFAFMKWPQMFVLTGFVGLVMHIISTFVHAISESQSYMKQHYDPHHNGGMEHRDPASS